MKTTAADVRMARVAVIALAASLMGACAFKPAEPALMYRLSITPDPALASASAPARRPSVKGVELMPLRSNRPQGGSLGVLVAQVGEVVRVEEFAAGRWEEPPETVLERALAAGLKRHGDPVVTALRPKLRCALDQFEMVEPLSGGQSYAAIAISCQLSSPQAHMALEAGETVETVETVEFQERERLPADAPLEAVVLAFNRASSRAVTRVLAILPTR